MLKYIDKQETIERFEKEHEGLRTLISSLSEEQMLKPKMVGEWSIKDIISHLAAWNWEAIGEVDRVLRNESTWPARYEDKAGESGFNREAVEKRKKMSWQNVLKDWDDSFWAQMKRMEELSEDEWNHQSGSQLWSDGTPVTVYSLFAYEYKGEGHEGGHAKQLREVLHF